MAPVADLMDLCRAALAGASDAEEAEAFAEETRSARVEARGGEVESLSASETRGVGVRLLVEGRLGYAWAADPSEDEAAALLEAARENARQASPDEANVLPDAAPAEDVPGLFRDDMAGLDPERKVQLALDLERAATSSDQAVRKVEEVSYGDAVSRLALASTRGVSAEYARTDCWCAVSALAERDGETQSGFAFRVAREMDDLAWEEAAAEGALRGARLLGAVKPGTERLPVVLDPWAASAFLGVVARTLSAEEAQKGRSMLAGRIGEPVAADTVTLVDDGRLADGPSSAPVDDEGVPCGRTELIGAGTLRAFLHNTQTAHREGASSTGNASRGSYRGVPTVSPTNLYLEPGSIDPEALMTTAGRAVYVQDVTGVHSGANPVSGEFSVGATGLRVEGGSLGEPLREMTIASTLLDVLGGVRALGSDLRFFPGGASIGSPTLLVGEMTVGGT